MHHYQWFFQGIVHDIAEGKTLNVTVDLGFKTWRIISARFNRLKIFLPNDQLCYFLEDNIKNRDLYLNTIRSRDRYGVERIFAEFYIDPENFPIAGDKEILSLREINRSLATGERPAINKVEGLININDFLVKQRLAEYVEHSYLHTTNSRLPGKTPKVAVEVGDRVECELIKKGV